MIWGFFRTDRTLWKTSPSYLECHPFWKLSNKSDVGDESSLVKNVTFFYYRRDSGLSRVLGSMTKLFSKNLARSTDLLFLKSLVGSNHCIQHEKALLVNIKGTIKLMLLSKDRRPYSSYPKNTSSLHSQLTEGRKAEGLNTFFFSFFVFIIFVSWNFNSRSALKCIFSLVSNRFFPSALRASVPPLWKMILGWFDFSGRWQTSRHAGHARLHPTYWTSQNHLWATYLFGRG